MRRVARRLVIGGIILVGGVGLLHWPVQTRQGVDAFVTEHAIPLYVKVGRFLYRDVEYRQLARSLVRGVQGDEARFLRMYDWVRATIHPGVPRGLPTIDDHVWDIIVRRYGTADQMADVLATLCAYAGIPADLVMVRPPGELHPVFAVAMVQIDGRWSPVDPYSDILIRTADGRLATRDDLIANPELGAPFAEIWSIPPYTYEQVLRWLPDMKERDDLRPYRHQPLPRVWYEVRRGVRGLFAGLAL